MQPEIKEIRKCIKIKTEINKGDYKMENRRNCTITELKLIKDYIRDIPAFKIENWTEEELNSFYFEKDGMDESKLWSATNGGGILWNGMMRSLGITMDRPLNEEVKTEEKIMKNITNEEKVKWIKENCCIKMPYHSKIDLCSLDFGDMDLDLGFIKAANIRNVHQEAETIWNMGQRAETITNNAQEASTISNDFQEGTKKISNKEQLQGEEIKYGSKSREELIKIIIKLEEK